MDDILQKRTPEQVKEDFVLAVDMLKHNKNWVEIAEYISEKRGFIIPAHKLRTSYNKIIANEFTKPIAESELHLLLDHYDWLIREAIGAWRESAKDWEKIVRQGTTGDDGTTIEKPFLIVQTLRGIGDPKYLNIIQNALKNKKELLTELSKKFDSIDDYTDYTVIDDNADQELIDKLMETYE